jgi:hypothetical protein
MLGHASLLAAVGRQEHDDPIRFAQRVGPEHQGIGRVERHAVGLFYQEGWTADFGL